MIPRAHFRCLAGRQRRRIIRCLSSSSYGNNDNSDDGSTSSYSSSSTTYAFDRHLKHLQRENAARRHHTSSTDDDDDISYDYLKQETASRLIDRLDDMKRHFPLAMDFGSGNGHLHRAICADDALPLQQQDDDTSNSDVSSQSFVPLGGIGGVRKLVQVDSSKGMLFRDQQVEVEGGHRCETYRLHVESEEDTLPFPDGTFDLVVSNCSMHWINKVPTVLSEIYRVLKPDGCLLMAVYGGTETLGELRSSMVLAEVEREGGMSLHTSPFIQANDVGSLLQSAGFALPTIDMDTITLTFPNAMVLMEHLQRMGENNASVKRKSRTSLSTFLATACLYDEQFPCVHVEGEHEVEATVQIVYAVGWTPHASQPKPKARGSASHKVGEVVDVTQTPSESKDKGDYDK